MQALKVTVLASTALALAACGGGADEAQPSTPAPVQLPTALTIPDPMVRATDMERVETWTEAIANTLFDYSDKLRQRDFTAAQE